MKKTSGLILIIITILFLISCVRNPPSNVDNVCRIFKEYPSWYRDAKDVEERWHVPVAVQMAIIHQESKFNGKARPPAYKFLGFIPLSRPSTAYGYTQALNQTWKDYTKLYGGWLASRDNFTSAVDFIGWYVNQTHKRTGISRNDAYNLYLAYHEGIGGFERKTYQQKAWLVNVAHKVKRRSDIYNSQLVSCGE